MGGVYSLIALGLSLIFGVMKVINFAHGEMMVWGMHIAYTILLWTGIDPFLSLIVSAGVLYVLGYLLQRVVVNRIIEFPEAKKVREKKMEWVLQLFPQLKGKKNQRAGTLSGGEQQMLAIGRGLMSRPTLLMLDEPSLGLSPILVKTIFRIMREINQQGTTILLVEQNVFHSLSLSHRGYVLENRSIVLTGSAQDLLKNQYIRQSYLGL